MHGEGVSTPQVRHKRRQPLIKCENMTSIYVIFPFFTFLCLFMSFIYFLSFCGRQGCFSCSYVSSMRNSDLRSSLRNKRWLNCFYPFLQNMFLLNERCRNIPFCGRAKARLTGALSKGGKMRGVATNVYLWKMSEKPKETGQNKNSKFGSCIYI